MTVVYVCECGCFHGWQEGHRVVRTVTRHHRGAMEDVWWCPACGREHRTHDGSVMGQVRKAWRGATAEELSLLEKGTDPRMDGRDGRPRVDIGPNGEVRYTCAPGF